MECEWMVIIADPWEGNIIPSRKVSSSIAQSLRYQARDSDLESQSYMRKFLHRVIWH